MIGAIVLAAGRSRRMGVQKLLLPLGDRPLVARLVDELLLAPVSWVGVVTGRDDDRLVQALAGRAFARVPNPEPDGDMLSSVRCGLRALPVDCAAALVVPGDAPGTNAALVRRLVEAYRRTGRSLVVPVHEGRRGHPLLIARTHFAAVLERFDGIGLRGLLRECPGDVGEVPVDSAAVLANLNRPEDYQAWTRSAAEGAVSDLRLGTDLA